MTIEKAESTTPDPIKVYDQRSFQLLPAVFFSLFLKTSQHHKTLAKMFTTEELFPGAGPRLVTQLFGTIGDERWTALFEPGARIIVMRPCTEADQLEWDALIARETAAAPAAVAA